jgi:asparagine synthase (glutamine-hydrolysing)
MRDALRHRGPDGAGVWTSADRRVGLAHRRLSIIDLSETAAQPMANEDASLQLVFNGEIYNHAEIRRELQAIGGYRWKTDHSDTEVILHAFEQWGIDCVHRFRGMFAFALWDSKAEELWLVRDRLGIKPLYYALRHGRLTFASEIKSLLQDPEQPRAVDEDALFHYLSFLTTPAPQTLFAGIRKLPAGTWIRLRADGDLSERRYWDPFDDVEPLTDATDDELTDRILDALREAVRYRAVSDVPVGVFLSGGIDSSLNARLFSEIRSDPVDTFSIGYDADYGSYKNELHFAHEMASSIAAREHVRQINADDLIAFLPQLIDLQDEPIADPVCVPLYYLAETARRQGVIVCQVGEGADELFWGYPYWRRMLSLQRWDNLPVPSALKHAGLWGLRQCGKQHANYYEWLRRGAAGQPIFWGGAEAFNDAEKHRLLSPRLKTVFRNRTSWEALEPIHRRFREAAWEPSPLHWMTYLDLNLRLPELLLMRVDKMTMGVGLEARVPFLDHKLVRLALSIPERAKVRHGNSKHLLKKAARGLIPDTIIDRPKQGFGVPVQEWCLGRLGDVVRDQLEEFCRETDYLDVQEVRRMYSQPRGHQLWYLLNLALWWKRFIAGESIDLRACA